MYVQGWNAGEKLEPISYGCSTAHAEDVPATEHRRPGVARAIATQSEIANTKKTKPKTKPQPQNPNWAEVF